MVAPCLWHHISRGEKEADAHPTLRLPVMALRHTIGVYSSSLLLSLIHNRAQQEEKGQSKAER